MADQKISQLTTISTVDTAADLFPIVDTSATETKKITPSALKTALALNNVDNTSDANKPISSATQTALDGKQDTLVSGTNIKTINSTSLLGSGDIAISASPSGGAGAIQFSNGSAFSSDATNLFWDDTNNRLGIGTNVPTKGITINANANDDGFVLRGATGSTIFSITKDGASNNTSELFQYSGGAANFAIRASSNASYLNSGTFTFGATTNLGAKVNIKGSGATSATTSLLVQNSAGNTAFQIKDDRTVSTSGGDVSLSDGRFYVANNFITSYGQSIGFYGVAAASALVEMQSTTKGFLPPRMTTTQRNAITTPAAGLIVYDSTTNKLCCYNGTSWNDLF